MTNLRIIALVVFIVLSAIPLACGFLGDIVINCVRMSESKSSKSPLNSVPLSLITCVGAPNLFTKSHIQFAVVEALALGIGYISTHLEKASTNKKKYLFFLLVKWVYKSPDKSTCTTAKGLFPFSVGCRLGLETNLGFIYEQCIQSYVNL